MIVKLLLCLVEHCLPCPDHVGYDMCRRCRIFWDLKGLECGNRVLDPRPELPCLW